MTNEHETSRKESNTLSDFFSAKELVQLVAKKLSSQALLFALATIVILVITGSLFSSIKALAITAAILFVFAVAMLGYLFFEQKRKSESGDPETMSQLLGERIKNIWNPSGDISLQLRTTPVTATASGSRDINVISSGKDVQYRIGDKIIVHFSASCDCYLTLLNIGTSGRLTILFPNALHKSNMIRANEFYEIPSKEYGFAYELQGPPGIEKLKAIATMNYPAASSGVSKSFTKEVNAPRGGE